MSVERLLCDSMLGGLARWLRAAGHDAAFEPRIDDGDLVARALASGEILLSSDAPLFERRPIAEGAVRALFVPRHHPPEDQATFVLRTLALPVLEPRCMACGGSLETASRDDVAAEVPPRTLASFDTFFRCMRCRRVLWHGSHWDRIDRRRAAFRRALDGG
jgi:uncharacterized protein with PIN domain